MEDYLNTFEEDTSKEIKTNITSSSTLNIAKVTHRPTGIYHEEESYDISGLDLLYQSKNMLKQKLKAYYEQEDKKAKIEESSKSQQCICVICGDAYSIYEAHLHERVLECGYCDRAGKNADDHFQHVQDCRIKSEEEKRKKKPMHPGKVAKDLLMAAGCCQLIEFANGKFNIFDILQASKMLDVTISEMRDILRECKDIDIFLAMAYKKVIDGTDIRFWMDLQERYDSYKGENK